jgi:hypothetical protein
MLQVGGITYRIERTAPHCYCVVRLLDDLQVGTFRTLPALRIDPLHVDSSTLRDVVRAALRSARTSAVMHVAPVFQPEEPPLVANETASVPPPARHPSSSAPPPASALA